MKIQQYIVLVFIALTIILFSILKISSESHDRIAILILKSTTFLSGLWFSFTVIYLLIKGEGHNPISSIIREIRGLFGKLIFLKVSIILFFIFDIILVHQTFFFRQVEFISVEKVELYNNPRVGKIIEIGIIEANTPVKYRIKVGLANLYYEKLDKNTQRGWIKEFRVNYFWKKQGRVKLKKIVTYEEI